MLSPTAGVYNGYQTVMWNNVRRCFQSELASLYQSVRAQGIISYETIEQRFEEHQNTWNEAIFNEDAYFKYIRPFVEDGENNLYMCLGSKAEQRKWWLYNRFRYIDSKYTAGYATSSTLQMRVYQKSDLTVTPYADIYASALFDSNLVKQRAPRGQATTLVSPTAWNPGGSDAVLRIYSADQIKSLGDLSGFYVGAVSFAGATKLQEVKLGDSDPTYQNDNLTEVTFGTNKLLKSVDLRNCPNLTGLIDVSHCENLQVFHAEGTSINGVSLADGGMIEEVYLPDTVTNLTLRNLTHLTTLELNDYSNLTSLWIENTAVVDGLGIVASDMAEGGRVRLVGFNKTFESDADFTALMRKMMNMRGIDSDGNNLPDAYIEGEVTVGELDHYVYDYWKAHWPFLVIHYSTLGLYAYALHLINSSKFTEYRDDTITNISPYAFYASYVKTVDTPNVTTIGKNAFESAKLETINAPLVTSIGDAAFKGTKITEAVFPELLNLGGYAFENSKVERISFPELTTISTQTTFKGSPIVTAIFPKLGSITPGTYMFQSCTSLKTVVFPKASGRIFADRGFQGCTALEAVDYGAYHEEYGNNYISCSSLIAVIYRSSTVTLNRQGANEFSQTPLGGLNGSYAGHIYVPQALIESYQTNTNFSAMYAAYPDLFAPIEGSIYETQYADGTPIPAE